MCISSDLSVSCAEKQAEVCVCCSPPMRKASLCCAKIYKKKNKHLKPFEMCGFGKTGCLMVKQLWCPHVKHHPQTGTHIQTVTHLSHNLGTVNWLVSQSLIELDIVIFFLNVIPQQKHWQTNKTVQHTTKQNSYLHPHPRKFPPDNKSSVSDQGSCHLEVLILRQKWQSHISALNLLSGKSLGMTCHCLQVETLDCP